MARQFFAANYRYDARRHGDNFDGCFLSLSPPSLGLNQVSGSSLATNPTIELHKNGSISLHSQATPLLGQVGLSHQVIETRTTIYSPNRVRVHTVIDYFPLETPPPALPPRNFNGATHNGTNIIRTQFHTVVDPLSIPNTSVSFHNQPVSHSINLTRVNQVFPNEMFHQTISRNQPTQIQNNANGVTVCSPVSVHNLDTDDEVASPDELAITLGSQNSSVSKNDQEQVETLMNPVVPPQNPQVDGGYQEVSYGTKSFPHKKYDPYTCARCQGKYETSQSFASHMALHYKSECRAERKRWQELKYKKRNLHLVNTPDGLTVIPASFGKMDNVAEHSTRNRGKEKVDVEAREKGKRVVKQEEGGVGMTIKQRKPYVDVVIKEEKKLCKSVPGTMWFIGAVFKIVIS